MKVYVSHSKLFDFEKELYKPLRELKGIEWVFPHEKNAPAVNSKERIKDCDAFIAEVSIQSIPVGIETGWAETFGKPIIFLIKKGAKLSGSLRLVSENITEYEKIGGIIPKLKAMLNEGKNLQAL